MPMRRKSEILHFQILFIQEQGCLHNCTAIRSKFFRMDNKIISHPRLNLRGRAKFLEENDQIGV